VTTLTVPASTPASDTIVAVSSPPGRSPRALVRGSGPAAFSLLEKTLAPPAALPPPRRLAPARLELPPALPCLLAMFPGPGSYTGEDLFELQVPGHPALLTRLVGRFLAAGARQAGPGEFTFRAFTAGRIDLTEAEGVAATIAAESDAELAAAGGLRRGELGRQGEALLEAAGDLLALVEAGIDFTEEEDVTPIAGGPLRERIGALTGQLDHLLAGAARREAIDTLPRVVLVGPPSTGKSSLMNALLGRRRVLVDAAPGTTRDVIEETLELEGDGGDGSAACRLADLAGLDQAATALDRHVQATCRRAIEAADLLLLCHDGRGPDAGLAELARTRPCLKLRTRADRAARGTLPFEPELAVSVRTGAGLGALRSALRARLARGRSPSRAAADLMLQPRHEAALRQARHALEQAAAALPGGNAPLPDPELTAAALRDATKALASLGGRMSSDEVLGKIFSNFCIGK